MRVRRALTALAVAGFAAPGVVAQQPARASACTSGATDGGDWPVYGHDLANTRSQPAESTIGVDNAGSLAKQWVFDAVDATGAGEVDSTPIVAAGCVFITSSL